MARNRTVLPLERAQVDVVQERSGVVGDRRISLRVCGEATQGYLLERYHAAPGEPSFVQRVNLFDDATIASFVEHDPYSAELESLYRAVIDVPKSIEIRWTRNDSTRIRIGMRERERFIDRDAQYDTGMWRNELFLPLLPDRRENRKSEESRIIDRRNACMAAPLCASPLVSE